MIVDTSALIAVARGEIGWKRLSDALSADIGLIPTPVLVEFERVSALKANQRNEQAWNVVEWALRQSIEVAPLDEVSARRAVEANARYGSGSGHSAKLNMLDLMVYGMAMTMDLPILCTGNDFSATDARIHPASRVG